MGKDFRKVNFQDLLKFLDFFKESVKISYNNINAR